MLATFSTIVSATNTPGDGTNTFIISAPGSYFLVGNITGESGKHGVSIQSDDVTLDLNGFAVIGGGGGVFRVSTSRPFKKPLCPQRHGSGLDGRRRANRSCHQHVRGKTPPHG